jgi:hypothetical protein
MLKTALRSSQNTQAPRYRYTTLLKKRSKDRDKDRVLMLVRLTRDGLVGTLSWHSLLWINGLEPWVQAKACDLPCLERPGQTVPNVYIEGIVNAVKSEYSCGLQTMDNG